MNVSSRYPWTSLARGSSPVLLCITTLGHRRFVDDAVQVVGLPLGSRILLRYRKRYVAPEVWQSASSVDLQNSHVLVVLGGDLDDSAQFEPLRVGKVRHAAVQGEILTLEVSLGGFASDGAYVWPGVARLATYLPAKLGASSDRSGRYVQILGSCPANVIVDESVVAWERAAEAFFRLDAEKKVPFLYFLQGQSPAFKRLADSGVLAVESGSAIDWDVHTRSSFQPGEIASPLGEVVVEVSCQPMRMVTSKRIRIDSRRDVKRMRIACDAVFRSVPGHLSVKVVLFSGGGDATAPVAERNPLSLSRHDIPVKAGRFLPTVASLCAGLAAGVALLDKEGLGWWADAAAVGAGVLVFLSLHLGFRSGGS